MSLIMAVVGVVGACSSWSKKLEEKPAERKSSGIFDGGWISAPRAILNRSIGGE